MRLRKLLLLLACAAIGANAFADSGGASRMLTLPHMDGTLALPAREIQTIFYAAAEGEKKASFRLTSEAIGGGSLTLAGADAEAAWQRASGLQGVFAWMPHMNGTLGIPRHAIRSLHLRDVGGKAQLRIVYAADPAGKLVEGADATRLWEQLSGSGK
jgi:hypothetical protein